MTKQIKRKIYLLSKKPMKPIEVVQFETGVQLVFEVQDIELDETATATLFVRKPSGKFVFQEDNVSLTGNTVVIDLHNQAIAEYGKPFFQIKFKKGEEVISTFSGMLTVEKSLDDSGAEESKTVIAAFDEFTDEQIARIEEATRAQIDLMKAEVEAKGETVLATIPDEYTEMYNRVNTLFNSVANAIKGTVSGSVVRVDDVSPVEHSPAVKVHGKNHFNYSQMAFENRDSALIDNGNGSITINAPSGSSAVSTKATLRQLAPTLKIGKLYTLSFDSDGTDKYIYLSESQSGWNNKTARIITATDLTSTVFLYASGVNTSATISNIQLEKGDTATEYTPYIDPSTVTVTRCGKNLMPLTTFTATPNSSTATVTSGILTVNGYLAAHRVSAAGLVGKTLTISCDSKRNGEKGGGLAVEFRDVDNNRLSGVYKQNELSPRFSFTVPESTDKIVVFFYASGSAETTGTAEYRNILLELGDRVTDYEPYFAETYNPTVDGDCDIVFAYPTMTLLTDTEGVTIECEYNKDTNKVLEKLTNAVAALGGAV